MPVNPIDLVTVAQFETYIPGGITSSGPTDAAVQFLVTSISQYFLDRIGVDSLSPAAAFNEWYDGDGSVRLWTKNRPIRTVTGLFVNGVSVPQSTTAQSTGWVIHASGKSIAIRRGGADGTPARFSSYRQSCGGYAFAEGVQNVNAQYTAGYDVVPFDLQEKVLEMMSVNWKRKAWIDQSMQTQAGITVRYRDWEIPPQVESCIQRYQRTARV